VKANIELLDDILRWLDEDAAYTKSNRKRRERIKASRSEWWNQEFYIRQTDHGVEYCVAGYAATRHGEDPVYNFGRYANRVQLPHGEEFIDVHARDMLGISEETARALFHWGNTRAGVRRMINEIKAGKLT
jgi:hypothetical protein